MVFGKTLVLQGIGPNTVLDTTVLSPEDGPPGVEHSSSFGRF